MAALVPRESKLKYNRIFIDIDGVLADFMFDFLKIYNKENGTSYKTEDVQDWKMSNVLKDGERFQDFLTENFWLNMTLYDWSKEMVASIYSKNKNVAFLTNIGKGLEKGLEQRRIWINKSFPMIKSAGDRLIQAYNKDLVVTRGDLLIDDNEKNIFNAGKTGCSVITLAQPWNKNSINRKTAKEVIEMFEMKKDTQLELFA